MEAKDFCGNLSTSILVKFFSTDLITFWQWLTDTPMLSKSIYTWRTSSLYLPWLNNSSLVMSSSRDHSRSFTWFCKLRAQYYSSYGAPWLENISVGIRLRLAIRKHLIFSLTVRPTARQTVNLMHHFNCICAICAWRVTPDHWAFQISDQDGNHSRT
jgi:hypothetical protein